MTVVGLVRCGCVALAATDIVEASRMSLDLMSARCVCKFRCASPGANAWMFMARMGDSARVKGFDRDITPMPLARPN